MAFISRRKLKRLRSDSELLHGVLFNKDRNLTTVSIYTPVFRWGSDVTPLELDMARKIRDLEKRQSDAFQHLLNTHEDLQKKYDSLMSEQNQGLFFTPKYQTPLEKRLAEEKSTLREYYAKEGENLRKIIKFLLKKFNLFSSYKKHKTMVDIPKLLADVDSALEQKETAEATKRLTPKDSN